MFAKLAAVILTIGAVAATLLAARQQRLYAVHESAEAMRRVGEHDRTLWRLRGEIAGRVTPGKVRRLADHFGPLVYLHDERPLLSGPEHDAEVRRAANTTEPEQTREEAAEDPKPNEPEESTAPTPKEQDA